MLKKEARSFSKLSLLNYYNQEYASSPERIFSENYTWCNKELFPSTAVTSQEPNERFRVSLGWSSLLLDSVTVCHLPKKAQLASHQCTNAEDKEVSALWIHFQQRRSYVVWGFQWPHYQTCHSSSFRFSCTPEVLPRQGFPPVSLTALVSELISAGRSFLTQSDGQPRGTAGHNAVPRKETWIPKILLSLSSKSQHDPLICRRSLCSELC